MEYSGKIVYIGQPKQVTDKFVLREFVVMSTDSQYPQEIKMQVTNKNVGLLDRFNVGDSVNVHINLRGRRYAKNGETNWYNSIEAWRIEGVKASNDVNYTDPYAPSDSGFDDVSF